MNLDSLARSLVTVTKSSCWPVSVWQSVIDDSLLYWMRFRNVLSTDGNQIRRELIKPVSMLIESSKMDKRCIVTSQLYRFFVPNWISSGSEHRTSAILCFFFSNFRNVFQWLPGVLNVLPHWFVATLLGDSISFANSFAGCWEPGNVTMAVHR